ncbi:hypothetical protein GCQ56_08250 [Marinifilum sp. N1E240]|uniref:sensor histidine kinase n=1 Tax=Marinifilum sp. N1E240 TaxID=2608082 RepID=UPI00128D4691|nr:sensor histidine kinase [Marinifilum sp. N1E240]MPQ47005.1 hypothetical protein [Marinifilum sp. N1E240]
MSIKRNIRIKQKIAGILIIFSLFSFGGILYTFSSSAKLDKSHVKLVENSEKIEIEVFNVRIYLNDKFEVDGENNSDLRNSGLDNANAYIQEIEKMISESRTYHSEGEKNLLDNLLILKGDIERIRKSIDESDSHIPYFDEFTSEFSVYEKSLHQYINETNYRLKREIFILLFGIFIILLVSLALIIRLMNSLIRINRQLVRNTMKVEQGERKRIAMDLHDGLGALLSSIGMYSKILEKEFKANEIVAGRLNQITQLSKQALDTVGEVINNLNPSVLNRYNLVESLDRLCDKINNAGKLNLVLGTANLTGQPQKSTEVILYRICNELINNTLKHASATEAILQLSGQKSICLKYSDNGKGFDKNNVSSGTGLKNITDRIDSIGGLYRIKSSPGNGFSIEIQVEISKVK